MILLTYTHLTLLSLFHRWLDKLGIAALTNHTRVFRQAFVGGHYSLLDSDQNPLPVSPNPDIIFIRKDWHVKHAVVLGPVPRERGGDRNRGEEREGGKVFYTSCNCSFRITGCQCCTRDWLAPGCST